MFRETDADIQMSLFDNPADLMGKRAAKKYDDPKVCFNQFFALVTSRVDESVFKPLFKEGNMGAPTASLRRLVAMSVLKEGFGCSDEGLVERLDYDLLSRKALGLIRIEDEAPSIDTYYLFRRRICEYAEATGENLMETCFSRLTGFQAAKFKISGRAIRMDSRLIGSNIAWCPRHELIHKTFLQEIGQYMSRLNPSLRKRARPWLEEDIPPGEKSKRNNVEASIFQLCFHTRNNKTRDRGKRKHELWAFSRCMLINLRRLVLFQYKMVPEGHTGGQNGPLSAILRLLTGMKQTIEHLKRCFGIPALARQWAIAS